MNTKKSIIIVAAVAVVTSIGVYANSAYAQSAYANNESDATETQDPTATEAPATVASEFSGSFGCWICGEDTASLFMEDPEDGQLSGIQNIDDEVDDFGSSPVPAKQDYPGN